ncbi:Yip1-domain-containing protein [Microthyrium microscopicum]|uniref:Protein YIP n=1 Tax=Microthyrium microscopicum TaxID=703497 RepID=A0A6A6U4G8_9PEZI|nr:Yip1-domain-containing protein [Microthyrium microscopicum]
MASNRGYDVVVDVDTEGDLGHTDLQEDLEFHNSNFDSQPRGGPGKIQPDSTSSNPFLSSGQNAAPKRPIFTLSFYSQFFDVDTAEVLKRCWAALWPRASFLDILDGNPDLYGPFWIATTVVFILFMAGTLNWRITGNEGQYDWGLMSGSAGLIYGYTGIVPVLLFFTLRWFGSESANLLECWCLYGYANLIWIPVALISWSTYPLLNFIFVVIGFAISTAFLVRNLYPVLSATDMQTSKILLIVVVVLHAGLSLAINILFFAHGNATLKDPVTGNPPPSEAPKEPPSMF